MTHLTQPLPQTHAQQGQAPMQLRPVPMPVAPTPVPHSGQPQPVQPQATPQPLRPMAPVPQMPQGGVVQPGMPSPHMPQNGLPQPTMPHPTMPGGQMPPQGNLLDYAGTARDWRMKRTNVKIYMGGLPAAIEFYHKENTPSLIIIESGMRGEELFNQLESLASVCDEGTKVVMIGAANDIRLYRQLMDKGLSDYLVPPLHPLNLIRSLGELYTDPDQPFIGRVVAFFGAKGGAGSSSMAHNTAWVLSEHLGQETALIDLDSSWGTTGLDFSYDNTSGLEEALGEPDRLDEMLMDRIMIRHTQKLSILPTSSSLNTKPVMDSSSYEAVVNAVRAISPISLLDMPHFWTDWTTNILTSVDDVVVTATPDLSGMRNAKNLIDFLKTQRPNDPEPILILNCVGMSPNTEISVKDFGAMVGQDPHVVIGWDPDSHFEATNEGKMLADIKTATQTVQGLEFLASRLRAGTFDITSKAEVAPTKKGLLSIGGGKPKKPKAESKSMFSFLKKEKA